MNETPLYKLEISLKRVQTFIFEVPRLKAMLGANAMIGEAMRNTLVELMDSCEEKISWPEEIKQKLIWPEEIKLTCAQDPLAPDDELLKDDPKALFAKGILARDGGHFIVLFPDETAADNYRKQAEQKLSELLPGVLFEIKIEPFFIDKTAKKSASDKDNDEQSRLVSSNEETALLQLPVLQICQETGSQPASCQINKGGEWRFAAQSVKKRLDTGDEFYKKNTKDIIGLMADALYAPVMDKTNPDDLEKLAGNEYIALIHADGNEIGLRYKHWKGRAPKDSTAIAKEAWGETFFHSMRVAVRRAVVTALEKTFKDAGSGARPYQLLMLGGDDLLLVCRASKALIFAREYVSALHEENNFLIDGDGEDGKRRLDVALGVAIAKHTYPLHRLHELAESLASSAKRLYRAMSNDKDSVIDWQIITQSWFPDVKSVRQRSECISYTVENRAEKLLLTQRPYRVLAKGQEDSLAALLASAQALHIGKDEQQTEEEKRAARSPLRGLRTACEQGKRTAEKAFERLPHTVQMTLTGGNVTENGAARLWQQVDTDQFIYKTRVLDVINIAEISRLGNKHD